MTLECSNCGAPYREDIPSWVSYVKCKYCGAIIQVRFEIPVKKKFDLEEFGIFLKNTKKIRTFDPVSGILTIGSHQILINKTGNVSGPKVLKKRVEEWITEYMSQ